MVFNDYYNTGISGLILEGSRCMVDGYDMGNYRWIDSLLLAGH